MEQRDAQMIMDLIGNKPSSQSVRTFCQEHNLSEARYYYWRNKLNKSQQVAPKEGADVFIPIQVKGSAAGKSLLASVDLLGKAVVHVYDISVFAVLRHIV
jgi:hypothetical protein